jgi:hypothetical protein
MVVTPSMSTRTVTQATTAAKHRTVLRREKALAQQLDCRGWHQGSQARQKDAGAANARKAFDALNLISLWKPMSRADAQRTSETCRRPGRQYFRQQSLP